MQQLQPPEDGLFLVRESARHPGDYVLCVSFGHDVIHYRVLHRDGHLTIDEAVCFCNLMDMVEHYRKDKGAICTKLVRPKRKQGTKSAQEELAKGRSLRPFPPTVAQPGEAPPCGLGTRPFAMCRRAQHCGQKAWAALGLGRRCPQAPGSPVLSISAASLLSPPSTCHLSQTPGPEPPSHLHPLRARS